MIPKSFLNKSPSKNSISHIAQEFNTNFKLTDTHETNLLVKIKSDKHDDWIKELKFSISASAGVVAISVSDEEDPCFLYKTSISESDFHLMKQTQNILIDFQQFPGKVLEMLDLCKENDNINNHSIQMQNNNINNISLMKSSSFFQCLVEEKPNQESILSIQEITPFKCSDYLKLNLKMPNDSMIKRHISSICLDYKKKLQLSLEENIQIRLKNEQIEAKLYSVNEEFRSLQTKLQLELRNYEITCDKQLIDKENKSKEEIRSLNAAFENKINEFQNENKTKINSLENKLAAVGLANESLQEKNTELNIETKELKTIKDKLNKENDYLTKEIDLLRSENKELNSLRYQNDKTISELSFKLASLQENTGEKDINNKTLSNLVETLKSSIEDLENKNKSLKEKLEFSCGEIEKANKIIEQKNLKINKQKQTLEQRQNSLRNQNTTITQLNNQILELNKKYEEEKLDIKRKDDELMNIKSQLEEERRKFDKLNEQKEQTEGALRYVSQKYNESNAPLASLLAKGEDKDKDRFGGMNINKNINMNMNMNTSSAFNITGTKKFGDTISTNHILNNDDKNEFIMPFTQFSKNKYNTTVKDNDYNFESSINNIDKFDNHDKFNITNSTFNNSKLNKQSQLPFTSSINSSVNKNTNPSTLLMQKYGQGSQIKHDFPIEDDEKPRIFPGKKPQGDRNNFNN